MSRAALPILTEIVAACEPGSRDDRETARADGRSGVTASFRARAAGGLQSAMPSTPWILLVLAGLLEVGWASTMKLSQGFTRTPYTVATLVMMLVSFALLARAMRSLPAGTAYAVWVGIGAVGLAIVGIFAFKEPATPGRLACLALIIVGVAGLKLLS